jgi:hypothetical protein
MDAPVSRRSRGWLSACATALLLVVALAVVHTSHPQHLHHGATAGLYNEEHVLAALDSVSGDAPLPSEGPGVRLDLAGDRTPHAPGARPAAPVVRLADSRAPPRA